MKKFLLSQNTNNYKANLHCHSTVSDGQLTPEEIKELYKGMGYSIVAFTDHNVMIPHPELADDEFLPLNGYEFDFTEGRGFKDYNDMYTCHICLIATDPDELRQVCWNKDKYVYNNALNYRSQVKFFGSDDFIRSYSVECINEVVKQAREHGFFVTYNHPTWSVEDYEQYSKYENFNAMEICNYGCVVTGYDEYNPRVYDDMLRSGKRLYCIGADDNHNWDKKALYSGGAWIMIRASKLEYKTITNALLKGDFYASQGPEIKDLWIEDGKIHITTSAAQRVFLTTANRRADIRIDETGEGLTHSIFDADKNGVYFRLTVVDKEGKYANTNAYFYDELDI